MQNSRIPDVFVLDPFNGLVIVLSTLNFEKKDSSERIPGLFSNVTVHLLEMELDSPCLCISLMKYRDCVQGYLQKGTG